MPAPPVARAGEMVYKGLHLNLNKETSMKLILATILAGSFLVSLPVKADDKPPAGDSTKSDKSAKKDKKTDKKADKGDKGAAPAGGGW
jgi:hypothetical protein